MQSRERPYRRRYKGHVPQAATCPRAQVWTCFTADTMPAPCCAGPRQALDACSRVTRATGGTPSLVRNPTIHPCDLRNRGGGVGRRSRTPKRGGERAATSVLSEVKPPQAKPPQAKPPLTRSRNDSISLNILFNPYRSTLCVTSYRCNTRGPTGDTGYSFDPPLREPGIKRYNRGKPLLRVKRTEYQHGPPGRSPLWLGTRGLPRPPG